MPEDTPVQGSEAKASEQYLQGHLGGLASVQQQQSAPEPTPEPQPKELLAGKYETQEALVEGYKNLQAESNRVREVAAKAEKFSNLIAEAEENPEFARHVMGFWNEGVDPPAPEPEVPGEIPVIDAGAVQKIVRDELREFNKAKNKFEDMEKQRAALRQNRNLTPEQERAFLEEISKPGGITMEDLYVAKNWEALIKSQGGPDIMGQIDRSAELGGGVAARAGSRDNRVPLAEEMRDDIMRVAQKTDIEKELGI